MVEEEDGDSSQESDTSSDATYIFPEAPTIEELQDQLRCALEKIEETEGVLTSQEGYIAYLLGKIDGLNAKIAAITKKYFDKLLNISTSASG